MERLEFASTTLEGVARMSLTHLHGISSWRARRNAFGLAPVSDFGLSAPFQLLTPECAACLREVIFTRHANDRRCTFSTARTSACVRGCEQLEMLVGAAETTLTRIASRLAGIPLLLHPMTLERAHVNVQHEAASLGVDARPVDDWHEDSMPFVLVTLLTEHSRDPGGALLLRSDRDGGGVTSPCKLCSPGSAVLMQGSQLRHCAQQSATGARLTMVTSFVPASPLLHDGSSLRVAVLYSPPGEAARQFGAHVCVRAARNARQLLVLVAARSAPRQQRHAAGEMGELVGDDDGDGVEQRLQVLLSELGALVDAAKEAAAAAAAGVGLGAADTPALGAAAATAAVCSLESVASSMDAALAGKRGIPMTLSDLMSDDTACLRLLARVVHIADSTLPQFQFQHHATASLDPFSSSRHRTSRGVHCNCKL